MRIFSLLITVSFFSLSVLASNIDQSEQDYLDCIDYGHPGLSAERIAACEKLKKQNPKNVTELLVKAALENSAVSALLQKSASEAGMTVKKCDLKVVSSSGKQVGSSVDGAVKIQQICKNWLYEVGNITTVEVEVKNNQAFLTSTQVERIEY